MKHPTDRIDSDLVNLDGGLFTGLRHDAIPLDTFAVQEISPAVVLKAPVPELNDQATTLVMKRVNLDSIAPVSMTSADARAPMVSLVEPVIERGAPAPKRSASWAFAAGVAVGVGAILAVGLVSRATPKGAPEAAAAAMVAAPMEAQAAAVPADVPAPAKAAEEPVKAREPVVQAPAVKVAEAPKDASKPVVAKAPSAPVAPVAPAVKEAPSAAAAPVSTADLPIEMPEIPAAPKAPEVQFNRSAAAVAIAGAGIAASSCKDEPGSMSISVSVTFANSGRATRAIINGGPFTGTAAGSCIASALRGLSVPAFGGEPVTVNTSLHLR